MNVSLIVILSLSISFAWYVIGFCCLLGSPHKNVITFWDKMKEIIILGPSLIFLIIPFMIHDRKCKKFRIQRETIKKSGKIVKIA